MHNFEDIYHSARNENPHVKTKVYKQDFEPDDGGLEEASGKMCAVFLQFYGSPKKSENDKTLADRKLAEEQKTYRNDIVKMMNYTVVHTQLAG